MPLAVFIMGVFGYLLDLIVLRRMFGQSQIAVVILTIALGFVLRFVAGAIWGHEPVSLESPIAGKEVRFGGLVLGLDEVAVIVVTVLLTVVALPLLQQRPNSASPCRPRRRTSWRPITWAFR